MLMVTCAAALTRPARGGDSDPRAHPLYPQFVQACQAYDRAAATRDFAAALDPARRSLELAEALYGSGSSTTAVMIDRLAYAENATGNFDRAIDLYEKAAALYGRQYGPDHEFLGTVYLNMGEAYRGKGDIARSLEYHGAALEIYTCTLPRPATTSAAP
jgi:tetratricopeptide (TPR) repeat protein